MTTLFVGLFSGILSALALIILIEKSGEIPRALVYGHYVFVDIFATVMAYILMPVVGLATMVNISVFCITFTSYLYWRRQNSKHFTILDLILGRTNESTRSNA